MSGNYFCDVDGNVFGYVAKVNYRGGSMRSGKPTVPEVHDFIKGTCVHTFKRSIDIFVCGYSTCTCVCTHVYSCPWYKTNIYLCNCMLICLYDRVALYPKVPQSKSLNEISLNPMALRDRQSTLRFENSISAVWKKKILVPNKSCWGIILKTSNLVSELLMATHIYIFNMYKQLLIYD